ncbi:MAG: glycosyltransferase [Planctomycetota bacterium]
MSGRGTRVRLSGAVVAQDSEATIAPVLGNLATVCDEIVVVDGGSSDHTAEIAASQDGVRLYRRPCGDNLGAQKNFAFDQCLGDWILSLDTDELVDPRGLRWLRRLIGLPGFGWFSLPRYWLVEVEGRLHYLAGRPYYRDRQIRLFRNVPGHRYETTRQPIHHPFRKKCGLGRPLRHPHVFHYAFLLADRAAREAKVARYLAAEPQSAPLHRMVLYEDHDVETRPLPGPPPGMLASRHRSRREG